MPQAAARADEADPLARLEARRYDALVDGAAGAGERGGRLEGDVVGELDGVAGVDEGVVGEGAVGVHADGAGAVGAVLRGAGEAVGAHAALVQVEAAHDAVAGLQVGDGGPDGGDGAGAFVRGGAGEGRGEDAVGDHGVGVAEGGDGDFDEEVGGAEGGWGDGDGVDFVGLFELLGRRGGVSVCGRLRRLVLEGYIAPRRPGMRACCLGWCRRSYL